jgi:hypothetical protein
VFFSLSLSMELVSFLLLRKNGKGEGKETKTDFE